MSKILLNTNKENQLIVKFDTKNSILFKENIVLIDAFYNSYDKNIIDFDKLRINFSKLVEHMLSFNKPFIFNIEQELDDFSFVSILEAININLDDKYTFIFNVKDKEQAKKTILNYKKLTSDNNSIELFKKLSKEKKLKPSSYVFDKLLFNYKPDYTGKKLLIIDTHNKYHRDYNAMPHMTNHAGEETMVIKSFLNMLVTIEKNRPDYIILATEGRNSIRKEIYPKYKENRSPTEEALVKQINEIENLAEKLGLKIIGIDKYEADDVIASYAKKFEEFGGNVEIMSTDKDLYQLLSDNIYIYNPVTKKNVYVQDCIDKFNVEPNEVRLFLSLTGDSSDNIPGVKGVGPAKASKYIKDFGNSVEDIIKGIDSLKEGSAARKNLEEGIDDLKLSYQLVGLYTYLADREYDFEKFKFNDLNWNSIQDKIQWFEIILKS